MYGCTAFPWIGPGRTSATWIVMSSRFSGRVRRIVCICARLSIWKQLQPLADALRVPAVGDACQPLEIRIRQAERLADIADRTARAIRREGRDERGMLMAVLLGDADDQLLADVAREIEIDVGDGR